MSITSEQAMQDLLKHNQLEREAAAKNISRAYRSGLLIGTYRSAGIISCAQYQMLMGMNEQVSA